MTATLGQPALAAPAPVAVRRAPFRLAGVVSLLILLLMTVTAAGGLWWSDLYRDNTWSTAAFRGGDLATLAVAVPVFAASVWWARRGSPTARVVWAGVLGYNVYNYAFYLFGTTFNDFFLLYAATLALSLTALVVAAPRLPRLPMPHHGADVVAAYLALIGLMFAVMWTVESLQFVVSDELPKTIADSGIHTNIVFALDLSLIVPAFLMAAFLLYRRRPAGLQLAVALNVLAVLYMTSLACAAGFQADAGIAGASWSAPPYLEIGALSVGALWLLLRHPRKGRSS